MLVYLTGAAAVLWSLYANAGIRVTKRGVSVRLETLRDAYHACELHRSRQSEQTRAFVLETFAEAGLNWQRFRDSTHATRVVRVCLEWAEEEAEMRVGLRGVAG